MGTGLYFAMTSSVSRYSGSVMNSRWNLEVKIISNYDFWQCYLTVMLIHNCVNTEIHSVLPWMKMRATEENKGKLWKTNTNRLKSQRTLVKVKFRGKLVEQFGNRSFPGKPVAANMTAVWFSPPKGINSLSSRIKYQFPVLMEMIKVGMNKPHLVRERLLYFFECLYVWVRHQHLKTQAEMPRGLLSPLFPAL